MLKFRNFGKKSLSELEDLIEDKGLAFGFDTVRYNLND
jgi:DNA-directed RNA polymerase subunit alpha